MHAIVTGTAGFIGSHLSQALIRQGWQVTGIDCLTPVYDRVIKKRSLAELSAQASFTLIERDMVEIDWPALLTGATAVFHLAGQAGVRASWGEDFPAYLHHNVLATQCLLEGATSLRSPPRIVFASSSSIYGDAETLPTAETAKPSPASPYGISKLAAEQLVLMYHRNFGLPVSALRYFSVYGPRQRPDMAFHRFMTALRLDQGLDVYANGEQSRDFTYVGDVVRATIAAATAAAVDGEVLNIGGGRSICLSEVLQTLELVSGRTCRSRLQPAQPGDARHTCADIGKAARLLHYRPTVDLEHGLRAMWAWHAGSG